MKEILQIILFLSLPCVLFTQSCFITFTFNGGLVCSDNGTPNDPSDDTYTAQVNVTGNNLGNNGWIASDALSSTGPYNQLVTIGPYLISDGIFNLSFQDVDDPSCISAAVQITPPQPCSNTAPNCDISISQVGNQQCDDNGTPNDPSDDTWTFILSVVASSGASSGWIASDPLATTGTYASIITMGPYPINSGTISLFATDLNDPNCTTITVQVVPPASCSNAPPCDIIDPGVGNITCDQFGSPSAPGDDFAVVELNPMGMGLGNTYIVTSPVVSASPGIGTYGTTSVQNLFGAAQAGPTITLTITDSDDPNCSITFTIPNPAPCATVVNCDLTNPGLGIAQCNDNGTPGDPSDDFYTFPLNPVGSGLGSGYTVTPSNGMLSPPGGNYGAPTLFSLSGVPPGSGVSLIITDNDDPNCTTNTIINPPPCPVPSCDINYAQVGGQLCDDNGTPGDPSDDTFTFVIEVTGTGTSPSGWTANDPLNTTGQYDVATIMGPYPISGGTIPLVVTDNDDPNCTTITVNVAPPATCSNAPTCNLTDAGLGPITCSDNGTPSDPSDDQYTYTLNPTGTGLGNQYMISVSEGTSSNPIGFYGSPNTFVLIDVTPGAVVTLTITDMDDPSCSITTVLNLPPGCSNQPICNLVDAGLGMVSCNDFGTPGIPGDDFLEVILNPTGTGLGNSYTVTSPFVVVSPGFSNYGVPISFELLNAASAPAVITLTITDTDDPNCSITVDITNIAPCTTPCDIQASIISSPTCFDNNTPTDPSDDLFNYSILVTNPANPSGGWFSDAASGTPAGNYGSAAGAGPFLIAAGPVVITFTDQLDPSCSVSVTLNPPSPCSNQPTCNLTSAGLGIAECNDNGTPSDSSDDFYTFALDPQGTGLGSGYTVTTSDGILSPTDANYGGPVVFSLSNVSSSSVSLIITDNNDPLCTISTIFNLPPCPPPSCLITQNTIVTNQCINGDPLFELLVNGNATGANYTLSVTDGTISGSNIGNYGQITSFTIIPAGSNIDQFTITVTDSNDPSCTATSFLPNPCPNCVLNSAGVANVTCNDNGTPSDISDDFIEFLLNPSGQDIGGSYTVTASSGVVTPNNAPYGGASVFQMNPGTAGNGDISITITDTDDPSCSLTFTLTDPGACDTPCDISATAATPICNDNGTPSDPNDDVFTIDITVNGTGTGWQADDPNNTNGAFGQTSTFGPFPISGGPIVLNFSLIDDPACQESIIIAPPLTCSNACELEANFFDLVCNDNGTPNTITDDTFTASLLITGTNASTGWNTDAQANVSGDYGETVQVGPFSTLQNEVTFNVTDNFDILCSIVVTIPSTGGCSNGCIFSDTTFINLLSCNPSDTGSVQTLLANQFGCDSLVITNTSLLPIDTTFIDLLSCSPSDTGSVQNLLTNQFGCDSLVITNTSLLPSDTTFIDLQSCSPSDTGSVQTLLANQFGCDSLVITNTSLLPSDTTFIDLLSCSPSDTGSVQTILANQFGCDSLVITNTSLLPSDTTFIDLQSCSPSDTGSVQTILTNQFGCDSLVITNTSLLPSDTTFIDLQSCSPSDTGSVQTLLANQFGCDSLVITNTSLLPSDTTFINLLSCNPSDTGCVQNLLTNQFGCDSLVITNTSLLPSDTTFIDLQSSSPSDTGSVQTLLANQFGCDSLVITNTSLLPSDTTFIDLLSCNPSDTGSVQNLLANQFGCDSLVITNTSLLESDTSFVDLLSCNPSDTGSVQTILANQFGCDSLVIINTSLLPSDTTFIDLQSCSPSDTGSVQTILTNQFGCDSLVITNTSLLQSDTTFIDLLSCNPSDTGSVQNLLANQFGCDSLVITNTSLLASDTSFVDLLSCNPSDTGSVQTILTNQFGCDSLVITNTSLLPSDTTFIDLQSCSPSDTGSVQTILANQFGCDSLVITNTSLLPSDTTFIDLLSCNPSDTGSVQTILANQFGCDSLVITNTSLLPSDTTFIDLLSCNPSDTGSVQTILANQFGCDSLVITNTSLLPSDTTFIDLQSCSLSDTGSVQTILANQFGCDSLVITNTSLLQSDTTFIDLQSCSPSDTGSVQTILANQFGCDSLVITNTSLLPSDTTFIDLLSCSPSDTGSVQNLFTNQFGCDSLVITKTLLLEQSTSILNPVICPGDSILINNQYYSVELPNGIDTLTAANGCDSLVFIDLTFFESPTIQVFDTILCIGEEIIVEGQLFNEDRPSGQIAISGQNGCDSLILEVNLSFSEIAAQVEVISPLCEGLPGSLIISTISGGISPYNFELDGIANLLIDTLPAAIPELFPGEYMLMVEDALECAETTGFTIQEGLIPFVDLGADIEAVLGDSIFLSPIINFNYDTLIWQPDFALSCTSCPNPRVIASQSVNIELTAMSDDGCMATDELLLLLNKQKQIYTPNVFSPNGDGRNDFFTLFANTDRVVLIERLNIFDRWGNQVFQNQDFLPNIESEGWNGNFKGEPMDSAVFVFYAQIRLADGEVQVIQGDITLIR